MTNAPEIGTWAAVMVAAAAMTLAVPIAALAQTFTTLVNFDFNNGAFPYFAPLVQGTDGSLYGTTAAGGNTSCDPPLGCGTVFRVTPTGTFTMLYAFCSQANCADGAFPVGGLVLGNDGDFYGTTTNGGADSVGTVFKITAGGVLTTLHSFDISDGSGP